MRGDFSVLHFDPLEHKRGLANPAEGPLRNLRGSLLQEGRVLNDGDFTDDTLLGTLWQGQAGRDIIGAGVFAVPVHEPDGFRVEAAFAKDGNVHVLLRPGRGWADGILTRLAGLASDPGGQVERVAPYFGSPFTDPTPDIAAIDDGARDAVILEVAFDALNAYQYPARLLEEALGGPDTAERVFVDFRLRTIRLGEGEDCRSATARLNQDPVGRGRLRVSLAPEVTSGGDCPVDVGGGYTGFEHALYRFEIDETGTRFKWSQFNGGLAGRARLEPGSNPPRMIIEAGRSAIVNSGLSEFYLDVLRYDPLIGGWTVICGTRATLNADHDLTLDAPVAFGALPPANESLYICLWNRIEAIGDYTNAASPRELPNNVGIRLVFETPAPGLYVPGGYWTAKVRAAPVSNEQVLIDNARSTGVVFSRVPLAEINWTGRRDTRISGAIEDCRKRFSPLAGQKTCCTFTVGDGVGSFGDFNSLEEAAFHLPASGGELRLLAGTHRTNLRLEQKMNIRIAGCAWRSLLLPRTDSRSDPILALVGCAGIEVFDLDLVTYDGIAVLIEACRDVEVHDTRIIARTNAIRATGSADLTIARNRVHLLDTPDGRAAISSLADDVLIERNELLLLPFVETRPERPDEPDDDPTRDPADPCAKSPTLYLFPALVWIYIRAVFAFPIADLVVRQPYRASGGIHIRGGSERVRIRDNRIAGGGGNGITLGGDLEPPEQREDTGDTPQPESVSVTIASDFPFRGVVQDEAGQPLADVDVYLEGETVAKDRSDAKGMVSIPAKPGPHTLSVSPNYRIIVIVREDGQGREQVHVITVAAVESPVTTAGGFLHEIAIEANDIAMMGLSGIGFALRAGTEIGGATPIRDVDPEPALRAHLASAIDVARFLRATEPVRTIAIRGNRLHHNLRNPFTEALALDATSIGRGGVSLAVVEGAIIIGNEIHDNGPAAPDPVCGVFIAHGDDIEIADNAIAGNGMPATGARERSVGLASGIYVRLAGAAQSRSSNLMLANAALWVSGNNARKSALRIHDNRIDQPAGRALTAFAFGPVSVVNNHLNSETAGPYWLLDAAVGVVLIVNLSGGQDFVARNRAGYVMAAPVTHIPYAQATQLFLPGGETLFDDNTVRLGPANQSIVAQAIMAAGDVGYASNTAVAYRSDAFFTNAAVIGASVRVTASRFREAASRTYSLLSVGQSMNMTALNQADHCIVALPRSSGSMLPTVDELNQVIDPRTCDIESDPRRFFLELLTGRRSGVETIDEDDVMIWETEWWPTFGNALGVVESYEATIAMVYQQEADRLGMKHGQSHPAAAEVAERAKAGAATSQLLAQTAKALMAIQPTAPEGGAAYSGTVVDERGHGLPGQTVEFVSQDGTKVIGLGKTDAAGFFSSELQARAVEALKGDSNLFLRVLDHAGKEVAKSAAAQRVEPGSMGMMNVVVPIAPMPRAETAAGTVIFTATESAVVNPGTPPQPVDTKPTRPESPTGRPLDQIGADSSMVARLNAAGIDSVEALLAADRDKLNEILGHKEVAGILIDRARALTGVVTDKPEEAGTDLAGITDDPGILSKLRENGIPSVEAMLDADPAKLATILGSGRLADRLLTNARELKGSLGSDKPGDDPLAPLGIAPDLSARLRAGGIVNPDQVIAAGQEKIEALLGDRAAARRVLDAALAAGRPSPIVPPGGVTDKPDAKPKRGSPGRPKEPQK